MGQFDDDVIYPNQPLADVACEVRFKGEMQVECERHRFWNAIRSEYPDILVPPSEPGQAMALKHYRFRSASGDRTVQVAINSLAYSETKYAGHEKFITEFSRLAAIFRDCYPAISRIMRIGWRYVNVMPFFREGGLVPLNRMTNLDVSLPSKVFASTASLDFNWKGRCLDGELILHLQTVTKKDAPGQEALLLDIDFGQDRADIEWSDVRSIIEDARRKGRGVFEGLITDEYRAYLKGETL